MLKTCIEATAVIYAFVAVLVFVFHLMFLRMVTVDLAFFRALVWPVFWATGWPHGTPLLMD